MAGVFPLLEEAETFRLVCGAGRPVFRWNCAEYAMFYAPGYLCVVSPPDADRFEETITQLRAGPNAAPGQGQSVKWGTALCRRAELAVTKVQKWQAEPFTPECLTLYMNNECNLNCIYCHTDPFRVPAIRLELDTIAAAAEVVATHCQCEGRPFYGVFHGGGEPTLHRKRVDRALSLLDTAATRHGVELVRYVATNGIMSEEKAVWMARRFDLIGLSCDGPAEVQNNQRPHRDGRRATSHILERTARILRQEGCPFHVRTTITSATLRHQAQIADYICQQLSPEEIHFEPVYIGGRASAATALSAHQACDFVIHFLKAREIAKNHGILLTSSGSRPNEIHGSYCHVFRHTINLVPGGMATACFKVTTVAQVEKKGVKMGGLNCETGRFELDQPHIRELCQRLAATPPECTDCFNRYHCVRECPDRCPLDGDPGAPEMSFRCQVQKALTYATLRETAKSLRSMNTEEKIRGTAIL